MKTLRLLLVKTGTATDALKLRAGDYDRWFTTTRGLEGHAFEVVHPYLGQPLPKALRAYDGILITGSPLSAAQPTAWMWDVAHGARRAAEDGVPVLGVCFGHQLLGMAWDVPVVKNPQGREVGTVRVQLTPEGRADPLFAGTADGSHALLAQATHEDIVPRLPKGCTLLAYNANTAVQAIRFHRCAWGVQFHPELSAAGMTALLTSRATALRQEGRDLDVLHAGVQHAPAGPRILQNFVAMRA